MPRGFRRTFRLDRASRADARASVDEELAHHVELAVEELVARGWSPEDARREALRAFGDMDETRTYCEDMQTRRGTVGRRTMSLDEIMQDLKYAARTLRKAPGYSALVVCTLAFGIAANTTIFSVMNPYLFRELPYDAPDELVQVNQVNPITGWDMDRFSYPQYEDWKARSRAFQDLGAYSYGSTNLSGSEGPEQVQISSVTANMFGVLGAAPALGRAFRPEEGRPGGEAVVILSHGLWERRYGADPSTVGRAISMDGVQRTVIGVMPPAFNFPFGGVKLWVPLQVDAAAVDRNRLPYQLIGRLNEGWSGDRVRSELTGIQRELGATYPEADGRMAGVTVKPLREALNFAWDILSISFRVLLGAVTFVLLIACVNVASLTLARASGRQREVAVRAAIGARRGRIIRQLLTESVILAAIAGVIGIGVSYWAASLLNPVLPEDLYRIGDIDIDRAVLAFSVLVTFATPVAFGLIPALHASRRDLTLGLKEGSKGSGGIAASRGRRALVVIQVGFAVILITGAGLMLRSFVAVQGIDLGFDADRLLVAEAILPTADYPTAPERHAFVERATARLASVPAVRSASAVTWLPLNHESFTVQVALPDLAGVPTEEWPLAVLNRTYPGYFETMGIDVLAGRDFGLMDDMDAAPVAIVSRALADRLWPGEDPVGRNILWRDTEDATSRIVIGVASDVRHTDLNQSEEGPQIYFPSLQSSARRYFLVARTDDAPAALTADVRGALQDVAPALSINVRPMSTVIQQNLLQWSISAVFLTAFGAGALLLATMGIYGLISFSVAQRQREIGVRIAMGASAEDIRRVVVEDGLKLTGMGLAAGLIAAVGLSRLAATILYGVTPFDPLTLAGVTALFLGVATMASLIPAARAARTDPIGVLRSE
jgi:putative ABC transport system permease protein